jgi:transposase
LIGAWLSPGLRHALRPSGIRRDEEALVITIGIDAHKKTHTAVAVDEVGRKLGVKTVKATSDGHFRLLRWARQWESCTFAVEDCRHLTRRLESDLLAAGQRLLRVPPQLMAAERRGGRERGKSDPIDALAVARAVLREPDLPVAELDGPTRELRLLVDHRATLVKERTRLQSRLRWHLHELLPELEVRSRGLKSMRVVHQVAEVLEPLDGLVAELARDLLDRIEQLNIRINQLEARIRPLVAQLGPSLLAIPGCGVLGAAKILGETGRASRFKSKDAFARFNGTAPVPVWSGNETKVRLSRGGNRQINTALHMIAVTQARGIGPGADYIAKRIALGDDKTEALRLLRRRLSNTVFAAMLADERVRSQPAAAPLELAA